MHSRTCTLRGSLPSAITRKQRSRSVTIPTSVPPPFFSTTGRAPACCSFINSAACWAVSSCVQQTGYSCIISETCMGLLLSTRGVFRAWVKQFELHLPQQPFSCRVVSVLRMKYLERRLILKWKCLLFDFFLEPVDGLPQPLIQLQLQFIASGRFVERLQGLPLFIEGNIPAGNCIRPLRKWNQLEQRAAGAWHKFLIQLMIGTGRRILKKHRGSPRSFFKVAVAALLK